MPKRRSKTKWTSMPNLMGELSILNDIDRAENVETDNGSRHSSPYYQTVPYNLNAQSQGRKTKTRRTSKDTNGGNKRRKRSARNVFDDHYDHDDEDEDNGDYYSASDDESTDEEDDQPFTYTDANDEEVFTEFGEEFVESNFEESCKIYERHGDGEFGLLEHDKLKNGIPISDHTKNRKIKGKDKRKYYEPFLSLDDMSKRRKENPEKYKRCSLKIEGAHSAVCTNLDKDDPIKCIQISGRSKCGRAFNGDEVLVEILNLDQVKEEKILRLNIDINRHNREKFVYGQVVGCFHTTRPFDSPLLGQDPFVDSAVMDTQNNPVFVCTIDESCNYLMKPVCKTIPKIHVLHNPEKAHLIKIFKYCDKTRDFEFKTQLKMDPGLRSSYIFLVAYINWTSNYPLGMVIDAIFTEDSFSTGMRILRLMHKVPKFYERNTVDQVKAISQGDGIDPERDTRRIDLCEKVDVFTIDPPGSRDLDDALSLEFLEDDTVLVGVHIADVTNVVTKDDAIDNEAQERATTFYPGQGINPYHMLPEPLATNLCSLIPGKPRKAISLLIRMDSEAKVKGVIPCKTLIKSRCQYNYEQVQAMIEGKSDRSCHVEEVSMLYKLARMMRERRLGPAMNSLPVETPLEENDSISKSIEAHYLVEEFMVLSNGYVGDLLMQKFPTCVPLRCQSPPADEKVKLWLEENELIADLIIRLQGVQPIPGRQLEMDNIDPYTLRHRHIFPLQQCIWNAIKESGEELDLPTIRKLMDSDELHPGIALALEEWIKLQETASYRCSGDIIKNAKGPIPIEAKHFSLASFPYLHFTSPIRRYTDIIVHRLLSAVLENKDCPYSQDEVSDMCEHINEVTRRAKKYQRDCQTLLWGKKMQKTPVLINAFISNVTEDGISLVFPGMRKMPSKYREILFKLLQVSKRPDTETDSQMMLHWSRRVYHRRGKYSLKNQTEEKALECQRLNPYQRTYFVQVRQWKFLHEKLQTGNPVQVRKAIRDFIKRVNMESLHTEEPGRKIDISSEFPDGKILKQACDFSMTFCRGQVLSIQISAEADKGVMVPSPQLFNMTRNSKCCLQHVRDPVKFLAKYSTTSTNVERYKSEIFYLSIWKPVMEMEFVTSAVRDHSCTINAVPVEFQSKMSGKFSLGVWYCKERDIELAYLSRKFIVMGEIDREDKERYCTDYLCIRCEIPNGMSPGTYMKSDAMPNRGLVWMAHAKITKLTYTEEERVHNTANLENSENKGEDEKPKTVKKWQVEFQIHAESSQPTDEMLTAERGVRCCVELIQKTETDRRIEPILDALKDATELAKAIALRRPIPDMDPEHVEAGQKIDLNSGMETLQPSNEYQCAAIRRALTHRFSLIHGPPGTGKTYTAMKLVNLFRAINVQIHGDGKHIIFCGPSNKSVDLVARWMKLKFQGIIPHVVRLYGTSLEHCDYPIPGKYFSASSTSKKSTPDQDLKDIAMHHLIRLDGKPNAKEIKQYDRKFKRYMEIMRVREERRKEKEHVKVRNLTENREIPDNLMEILTQKFLSIFDFDDYDSADAKQQRDNVFDLLEMRYANLVDKAEDKRIDVKSKQFLEIIEAKLKNFIEELYCEQRDEAKESLLTEIRMYKDLVAESVHKELQNHHIIFCTTAVATSSRLLMAMKGRVQQLIIDECGMCTEPESLAAIIATRAEQVILIGDHKQLRPIIICNAAADLGLERSLFERYEKTATMLRFQYRMHPEICRFPSNSFYDGRLETKKSSKWMTDSPLSMWRDPNTPIVFCHVEGTEEHLTVSIEEGNEMSSSNVKEVDIVLKVFSQMVEIDKVHPGDINVMSQYNAQCYLLKQALEKRKYEGFNVNTVVASQGGEWDYVILSTVRSLPKYRIEKHPTLGWCKENLGFITDKHQINVALTRARKGLVIIGNRNLLQCDHTWRKLIKHYGSKGCFVDSNDEKFPRKFRSQKVSKTKRRRIQEPRIPAREFYRDTDMEDEYDSDVSDISCF